MVGVAGGLALTGLRPIVHSYAPFLVERAYEQVKLDLDHQGVGAVLVSVGASYDRAAAGRTHLSPADVALIDTLHGWTVHVPGHPAEVPALLRDAVAGDGSAYLRLSTLRNDQPHGGDGALAVLRDAGPGAPLLVAVGPVLDAALAAVADLPVTVAYTHRPRPFDVAGPAGAGRWRGDPGRALPGRHVQPGWCRRRWPTGRTGCWRSAWAGRSCAATARPRTTPAGTGWTRPACAVRSTASWPRAAARGR